MSRSPTTTLARPRLAVVLALAAAVTVIATAAPAEARPRPRSSSFEANKTFGLGIMLGEPSGLSGKYFLGQDTALDFGLGYLYHYHHDGLHLHADFLWHPAVLAKNETFWLPIYFGIGARFFDHDDHDSHLGLRVPVGIAFDFQNVPLDIFLEAWFAFDVIVDDDHADGGLSVGVRYWF